MKNLLKFALYGLLALGISRGVAYMVGALHTQQQVTQINQRAEDPKSEPILKTAEAKKEFMSGCDNGTLDGQNFDQTAYCSCLFDRLENKYGVNKLLQMTLNSTQEELQNLMTADAEICITDQGIEV